MDLVYLLVVLLLLLQNQNQQNHLAVEMVNLVLVIKLHLPENIIMIRGEKFLQEVNMLVLKMASSLILIPLKNMVAMVIVLVVLMYTLNLPMVNTVISEGSNLVRSVDMHVVQGRFRILLKLHELMKWVTSWSQDMLEISIHFYKRVIVLYHMNWLTTYLH